MNKWVRHLAFSNIKKHRKRNAFSIISLIVGLTSSFLIIGFSFNAKESIKRECFKQLDYGSLTITKENRSESSNGGLSIIRNTRPTREEMQTLDNKLSNFEFDLCFDALVPNYSSISVNKEELKDFTYECIYSFIDDYLDEDLLIEGNFPKEDSLLEVVINESAYKEYTKHFKNSPIGKFIKISYEIDFPYYLDDENQTMVRDYFSYNQTAQVVGVVKDLTFLSTPKIYYSYLALKDYLSHIYLNNLSTYLNKDYSWVDRVDESNGSDPVNGYTYRLFLKKAQPIENVSNLIDEIGEPFFIGSNSQTRTDALLSLVGAASTGMELFLIISLIGTALIMGIVSFSFYSEDKKTIAILSCLGAKASNVNDIYCFENIFIALLAFIFSIILAPILQVVINLIVKNAAGYSNIIGIPFIRFMDIPFGLPLLVFISTLLVAIISTLLPIAFSKKISLKEELKDE